MTMTRDSPKQNQIYIFVKKKNINLESHFKEIDITFKSICISFLKDFYVIILYGACSILACEHD